MGVVSRCVSSGCGCKEVYRFPHITYPYSSCIYLFFFAAASLLLVNFLNVFRSCSSTFFVIYLKNFTQNKQTYGRLYTGVSRKPYEGLHIMFYTRRSTHKRTLHILRWTSAV